MLIKDFFSHKIHSSGEEWPDRLVEIASLFAEFNGKIYDRSAIETRLRAISPRSSYAARDTSKFRDEFSAYPAYLGIFYLEKIDGQWILTVTETAKQLLTTEEPDVPAFMRLQLLLFQYPNAMGGSYTRTSVRIQANARDRTLLYLRSSLEVSPMRLICRAIEADAKLSGTDTLNAEIAFDEIYALANDPSVYSFTNPDLNRVIRALDAYRSGAKIRGDSFERRFHILRHTELFNVGDGKIRYERDSGIDPPTMRRIVNAILESNERFAGFDGIVTHEQLANAIESASWGKYFDALRTIDETRASTIGATTNASVMPTAPPVVQIPTSTAVGFANRTYELRAYTGASTATTAKSAGSHADPELTKLLRQKRNLYHKILVDKMSELLKALRAEPRESAHIDLYAEIPGDGSYLFEVKSGGPNLFEQLRKGLSQLYEYRYRYRDLIREGTSLCIVANEEPAEPEWYLDYLVKDRGINFCWFDQDGKLRFPKQCHGALQPLLGISDSNDG